MKDRFFSRKVLAAPFGRYQARGEVEAPADEVLIGREGERAYFTDQLLRTGGRGAYLVTGHRGVGKTNFVRYCLDEYKREVFERFLRSNVGRATFWDRIAVLALVVLFLLLALLVSEFGEFISLGLQEGKGTRHNLLVGFVIAPLFFLCLYPALFAREVLDLISRAKNKRGQRPGSLISFLGLSIYALIIWFTGPFGAPALGMSRFLCAICAMYLWGQCTSFRPGDEQWKFGRLSGINSAFLSLLVVYVVFMPFTVFKIYSFPPLKESFGNIGLACVLLGMGCILRGSYVLLLRPNKISGQIHDIAAQSYSLPGLLFILAGLGLIVYLGIVWAMILALVAMVISAGLFLTFSKDRKTGGSVHFSPQPLLVLWFKAILAITISLQLIHPVVAKLSEVNIHQIVEQIAVSPSGPEKELREKLEVDKTYTRLIKSMVNVLQPIDELWPGPRQPVQFLRPAVNLNQMTGLVVDEKNSENHLKGFSVFHGVREEIFWTLCVFLSILVLSFVEYEWVVRPFLRPRADGAIDLGKFRSDRGLAEHQSILRDLAEVTFPWIVYRAWLPVIVSSVNLGFERLDHRRVIQAMLVSLRARYEKVFLAWNSAVANLGRLLGLLIILFLVNIVGERWFAMPNASSLDRAKLDDTRMSGYKKICLPFEGRQLGPGAVNLICKLPWGDEIFHILTYNLATSMVSSYYERKEVRLLFYLFPYQEADWPDAQPYLFERGVHVRVYHVLLFFLFVFIGKLTLRRLPIFPYRENLNKIDEVIDQLSATTSLTSTTGVPQPSNWLRGFLIDERVRHVQQEPVDPRTVEFAFLQILGEIRSSTIVLPAGKNQLISLPTPEITFVFDELDKLEGRVEPGADIGSSGNTQEKEILHAERRRSAELHGLLADMKNLLSSAPARFIFVGGRNLHDEWLADQTARQPLLTNIFNAEVYLPSLLTDDVSRQGGGSMDKAIKSYIQVQTQRARDLYQASLKKRRLPSFSLSVESYADEAFVKPDTAPSGAYNLQIFDVGSGLASPQQQEILEDFIHFLAYRSKGNPKRLKELLASFVRPVGRVILDPGIRERDFPCDHILVFDDVARFRIQLLARAYRHLTFVLFKPHVLEQDDKLAMSVLFLADFLFKFHRRAFSWSNLERVDEFVDIHRPPNMRDILEKLVTDWTSRLLHPIRNGMYDFRFRSEVSSEIEYISRESQEEMAAFNFTLDESLALKSVYESAIERLKEGREKEIHDLMAGLGELYEFDQEYETARLYYRKAISLLDADLREVIGGGEMFEEQSPVLEIVGALPAGQRNARLYMTWGITRLRLMLQIGMTFELSRNYERAEAEYRNAHTLARSLLLSMLDNRGRKLAVTLGISKDIFTSPDERLQEIKHLTLLFQPAFAEAWVGEKLAGAVDTSAAFVEKELWDLRRILPCVRDMILQPSEGPTDTKHAHFSLIISELHNKAGDLFFMKGRQLVRLEDIVRQPKEGGAEKRSGSQKRELRPPWKGQEGYLHQAHYHYCMALHELRRYIALRRESSKNQLNVWTAFDERWPTFSPGAWPSFVYSAAGEAFNDLAEAMIARVSFHGLLYRLSNLKELVGPVRETKDPVEFKRELVDRCTCWLEAFSTPVEHGGEGLEIPIDGIHPVSGGTVDGWLGIWRADKKPQHQFPDRRLLNFDESTTHADDTRLTMALSFIMVGAKYIERGGFYENAARELLKVGETVALYFWWELSVRQLFTWAIDEPGTTEDEKLNDLKKILKPLGSPEKVAARRGYWRYLKAISVYCLRKAGQLYHRSRSDGSLEGKGAPIPNLITSFALNIVCSLGLAAYHLDLEIDDLEAIRFEWTGRPSGGESIDESLRHDLTEAISRYSFPMINRLNGLTVLIQDAVMRPGNSRNVVTWASELMELQAHMDAPMYFSPFSSGMSYGLAYWYCFHEVGPFKPEIQDQIPKIRRAAQRDLNISEEMFTLRPAYYENICGLYYLYDDFNDRQIHFNHAIQMAGSELASLLKYSISLQDRVPAKDQAETAPTPPPNSPH
ncbi:MAG TPA: hypothetical protein VEW48_18315 [Thermoanaerobaculia bacterium]|nr:hypothetical protein [Thermoanaerobaculia bacterium]